jgi:hypothetical protein
MLGRATRRARPGYNTAVVRSKPRLSGLFLFAAASTACGSAVAPSPIRTVVEPIQVDSVDVSVRSGPPASVSVHVTGFIGDGCATLIPPLQFRQERRIRISITRERVVGVACTQIAKLFDETLALSGDFPPGDYLLQVNSIERPFTVR